MLDELTSIAGDEAKNPSNEFAQASGIYSENR
jgi:hypothetical protein